MNPFRFRKDNYSFPIITIFSLENYCSSGQISTPIMLYDILSLEESNINEGAVEVEHLEHISPDSQVILVLQLGLVVLPFSHVHSKLGVILRL